MMSSTVDRTSGAGKAAAAAFSFSLCIASVQAGQTQGVPESIGHLPAPLQKALMEVAEAPPQDFVKEHMEAGVIALELGEHEAAARSFDLVLNGITAVYADNERAAQARSLWYEEGQKDFKGEPYERVMAFYYRGLLDLYAGDYENARASFKSGLLQDAFAEEKQNQADVALLIFLQGWASHLLGDDQLAEAAFDEVKSLRPDFEPPAADDNTLILVETGRGPRKLGDGVGHYELVYRPGKYFDEKRAKVKIGDEIIDPYPMESIYWQATTRGGRPVDRIIEGQVKFKQRSESVGSFLTDASTSASLGSLSATGMSDGTANTLGMVGVAALFFSAKSKPKVDTRYWDNLPDGVHTETLRMESPPEEVMVGYLTKTGKPLPDLTRDYEVHTDPRGNHLIWARSRYAYLGENTP